MKKYLQIVLSLCLALTVFGTALPAQAIGDDPFFVVGYSVERTDGSGNPKAIRVTLMRTDGGEGEVRVVRNVDDFSGGSDEIAEDEGSGKYSFTFTGLSYKNSGNTLSFTIVYDGNNYQKENVTIAECAPVEEEEPEEIAEPRAVFSTDGLSAPISANETAEITVYIENAGDAKMENPVVTFNTSGDLMLLGGKNSYYLDDIRSGRSAGVTLTVKATETVSSQNQYIEAELNFDYDNNIKTVSGSADGRVSVPAKISTYVDPDSIDSPVPTVILSGYNYGGSSVAAGASVKLGFTFKNTSKTLAIDNVVVTVSGGVDLMLNGSGNTFYFDEVKAGESKSVSVPMKAAQRISANTQDVTVSIYYEYVDHSKRSSNNSDLRISVPLYQPDRFEVRDPQTPYVGAAYEEISMTMDYVNRGKTEIDNLEAVISGDIESSTPYVRVGTVEAGKNGTIAFSVTPLLDGENHVTIRLSYEDSNGEEKERVFETVLTTVPYEEPIDGDEDFEEPIDEGSSFPWWILILAVLVGGVVVLIVRKKKKKKAKLAAEQALWDSWDDEDRKDGGTQEDTDA